MCISGAVNDLDRGDVPDAACVFGADLVDCAKRISCDSSSGEFKDSDWVNTEGACVEKAVFCSLVQCLKH